jgi:hypothetical protein
MLLTEIDQGCISVVNVCARSKLWQKYTHVSMPKTSQNQNMHGSGSLS